MGSHSFRYLLPDTGERLTPASQAGTQFTYPRGMEGRVGLGGWLYRDGLLVSSQSPIQIISEPSVDQLC